MAHRKNEEFYLYTGLTSNGDECYEALMHMRNSGVLFRHLHYGEPNQHEDCLASIKTWKDGLDDLAFPFVTYVKVHDFEDPVPRVPEIIYGLENIKNTNWLDLYNYSFEDDTQTEDN